MYPAMHQLHQSLSTNIGCAWLGRSWQYLDGKQLDCFTCSEPDAQDDAPSNAPVSLVTGVSADGGVPAASATAQSDAARQDLGDEDDADMGEPSFNSPGLLL